MVRPFQTYTLRNLPVDIEVRNDINEIVGDIINETRAFIMRSIALSATPNRLATSIEKATQKYYSRLSAVQKVNIKKRIDMTLASGSTRGRLLGNFDLPDILLDDAITNQANKKQTEIASMAKKYMNRPVVESKTVWANGHDPLEIKLVGKDPKGKPIKFEIVSIPSEGNLSEIKNDMVTYTPNQDFHGVDEFKYRAKNSDGLVSPVGNIWVWVSQQWDEPAFRAKENLQFILKRLKCATLTDGPGNDDIVWSLMAAEPSNKSHRHDQPETEFADEQEETYNRTFSMDAKEQIKDENGKIVSDGWPKFYLVTFTMADIDDEGFKEFLDEIWKYVRDKATKYIASYVAALAIAGLGALIGAEIGSTAGGIIGAIVGAAVGAIIGGIYDWITGALEDDPFDPLVMVGGLTQPYQRGGGDVVWPGSTVLKGHGGSYIVTYEWRLKD